MVFGLSLPNSQCLGNFELFNMRDTELKEARDCDLFLCYQQALRTYNFQHEAEVINFVCSNPAPRFYISSDECSNLLGRFFAGKRLERMHPLAYKRLKVLAEMYKQYVRGENGMKGLSRDRVCEALVDMPAPEFYVSPDYARKIIKRQIAKHNKEFMRRVAI